MNYTLEEAKRRLIDAKESKQYWGDIAMSAYTEARFDRASNMANKYAERIYKLEAYIAREEKRQNNV